METRSIVIGLVAVVAAFAAAFGAAKSGGDGTENAGAGVGESIKVAAPAAVAGVEVGGTLPALEVKRKAPAKKKKASNATDNPTTTAPETDTTTPPADNTTTPPANNNTTPPANNNTTPPANNNNNTEPEEPASGGGEDG